MLKFFLEICNRSNEQLPHFCFCSKVEFFHLTFFQKYIEALIKVCREKTELRI